MKKITKVLFSIIVLVIILVGCFFAFSKSKSGVNSFTQSKQSRKVVKKNIHLVALGDSLTYGQGDEKDNGGYVGIIKTKLQHRFNNKVTTVNYGVSGDRSDQILKRLNTQSSIRSDLKKADVIVMTVGGNDLMQTLQKDLLNNSTGSIDKDVSKAGVTYQNKLKKLFTAVRKQNPKAPLFVFSIYNPVYTYFPQVKTINSAITKWNQTTKQTLRGYSPSYFVDINHLMSFGQYKTVSSRKKLMQSSEHANSDQVNQKEVIQIMNGKNHNLNKYISTDDNFHPNHLGYRQMTHKLYRVMLQHDSFEYENR